MLRILAVLLVLMTGSLPAWAALGDDVSSVDSDLRVLGGQRHIMAYSRYSLHQITTTNGSIVKEFVSPAGKVFGVSWQGNSMPNLQQLLGSYMTEVQRAERTQIVRRRSVLIQTNDLEFYSIGHLRSFQGHAYVPGLIPSDVTPEVVK